MRLPPLIGSLALIACGARSTLDIGESAAEGLGGGPTGGGPEVPSTCGNGVVEPDEACDVAIDPLRCDSSCRGRQLRTLTLQSSQAAAVTADARVRIWGTSFFGTFGGPPTPNVPVLPVTLPMDLQREVSSYYNVCTVDTADGARCAGSNSQGELGLAPTSEIQIAYELLPLMNPARQLVLGASHACVIDASAKVSCWGASTSGQVDGQLGASTLPPTLLPLEGIVEICAADLGNCARDLKGRIHCWGDGQTGFSEIELPPAVELACGSDSYCARFGGGQVACWGWGETGPDATPEVVPGVQSLVRLGAPAGDHACGVAVGNLGLCWGSNTFGELGRGAIGSVDEPAGPVMVVEEVAEIVAGSGGATCARLVDGAVACWGNNQYGVLGTLEGSLAPTAFVEPVLVPGF